MSGTHSTSRPARSPVKRWWRANVVATVEHKEVIERIDSEDGWSAHYAFMILMSAGIAVCGLILSSPAVVIGAMLISPLMGPIIGLGFGLAQANFREIRRSGTALAVGVILSILFSALIVAVSPLQAITEEIASRTRPNLFDLFVALFSGLAGTYAMIRGRHGTIVGVAIATALMPPLSVIGYGIATTNWAVFSGSTLLFFTNFMTIAISAAILARLYGFAGGLSPKHTGLQVALVVTALGALAVPLGLALKQIAWEAAATREAREIIAAQFGDGARIGQIETDFQSDPIGIRATVFTQDYREDAAREAEGKLKSSLGRPISLRVDQFEVEAGNQAEELELAAARTTKQPEPQPDRSIAERLALVAGVPQGQVLVDTVNNRAVVRAQPLPGSSLASYRVLEERVSIAEPDWQVSLIPPAASLPIIPLEEGMPTATGQEVLKTAVWAARRLSLPVGIDVQSDEAAERLLASFKAAGVQALRSGSEGNEDGGAILSWLAPSGPQTVQDEQQNVEEIRGGAETATDDGN